MAFLSKLSSGWSRPTLSWPLTQQCIIFWSTIPLTSSHSWPRLIYVWPLIPAMHYALLMGSFKGTNGRQKTYEIFHVYCIFYSGFMCQTTVIFGTTKDGSLVLNTLASWNCFTCRNLFQNGANDMSEWLTFETAFCKKSSKFCIVWIIRFWSNFASLWQT